jgi:TonB family protein
MINYEINGYKLITQIGKGGMAEVWYAENSENEKAAIKIMLGKFIEEPKVIQRFQIEAKAMHKLNHSNIRKIIGFGTLKERPAIIMEYLEGVPLSDYIKFNKKPSNQELKNWWKQCIEALSYVHKNGIIHRDIKPSNIFLCNDETIKILDFGIAKVTEETSITSTGQGIGTIMYMSPEQVKNSKLVTSSSDIYSLGITFLHLITCKIPFKETDSEYEILHNIVKGNIIWDDIPNEWKHILKKTTNISAENRAKAEDLLIDISNNDKTIVLNTLNDKSYRNQKNNTKKNTIFFIAVLILVLIIIFYFSKKSTNKYIKEDDIKVNDTSIQKNINSDTFIDKIKNTSLNKPIVFPEQMPEFPGGEDALIRYLQQNIRYPKYAAENEIEGTVQVEFIVNEDGSIQNTKVVKGIKGGCDEEALRVVKSMPKWKPGKQDGHEIKVYYTLPITFRLE